MTAEAPPTIGLQARRPFPPRLGPKGSLIYKVITTTDHKMIGIMYMVACFIFLFHRRPDGAAAAICFIICLPESE